MARMLGEKIELITALADDLGYVKMDPAQLRQTIFNLVLNAQDAMPQGGRVTIETRNSINWLPDPGDPRPRRAPCIQFTVTDTGRGMYAETREHLFELYVTTKSPGHGNGLGLATVNTIVTQHGGFLQIESKLGSGTRVTICLPRVASNGQCQSQNESFVSFEGRCLTVMKPSAIELEKTFIERGKSL